MINRVSLGGRLGFSLLLSASACVAPSQDFPVGSELWLKANPEAEWLSEASANAARHRVKVAVLDTGLDYNVPSLRKHLTVFPTPPASGRDYGIGYDDLGKDFFPFYAVLDPESGEDISGDPSLGETRVHGTHVAQLVTLNDPSIGLLPIRVMPVPGLPGDKELKAKDEDAYSGEIAGRLIDSVSRSLEFASRGGAAIANLSFALDLRELVPPHRERIRQKASERLLARMRSEWEAMLIVAAAGNDGSRLDEGIEAVPATLDAPDLLAVGSLKTKRIVADDSNFGRYVDVYVRGSDIMSALPGGGRGRLSGTSMAAPIVSHLAAQLKAMDPTLKPRELRAFILNTAETRKVEVEGGRGPAREVRVADSLRARRTLRRLLANPSERAKWLAPPFAHGAAPQ